jgi:hypothetical protein
LYKKVKELGQQKLFLQRRMNRRNLSTRFQDLHRATVIKHVRGMDTDLWDRIENPEIWEHTNMAP